MEEFRGVRPDGLKSLIVSCYARWSDERFCGQCNLKENAHLMGINNYFTGHVEMHFCVMHNKYLVEFESPFQNNPQLSYYKLPE